MTEQGRTGCLRLAAVVIAALGCVAGSPHGSAGVEGPSEAGARKVVATVNGEPIYEDQLQPAVEKNLAQFARYGARTDDASLRERVRTRKLNELIDNLLVYQESKKRKIEDIDEKIDQRVKDLEEKHGAGERMERYLRMRRTTMDGLRKSLEANVRVDEYLKEQGVLEPEIPEERIREMYDGDPQSFATIETIRASHILVAVDAKAGEEEKKQARKKAQKLRKQILAGGDFAAIAKEQSDCKTAARGGDLGDIKRGFMPAAFDEVAFSLEKDAVSEPVETRFGYHVIKLVDREPARLVPYEEMRDFLEKYLQDEESKKRLAMHVAELRERSEIEILPE